MSNLSQYYKQEVMDKLIKEFNIKNKMSTPKLEKIVVNCGLGEALTNKKLIEIVSNQLASITGQKPLITYAKRDISSFKLRKGDAVGLKVTLRGQKMYDFFEKLVKIVFARIRDFKGVNPESFDKSGNYTVGLAEQIVFPEVDLSNVDKIRGLEITFVTTTNDKNQTKKLLQLLGLPFAKR